MGLRAPEATRANAPSGNVVVFSASELIGAGLAGLLPREWRERIDLISDVDGLAALLAAGRADVIVDADAPRATVALRLARSHGGSAVLLLGSGSGTPGREPIEEADAVLHRDQADPVALRIALAVGRIGMRLVPREETSPGPAGVGATASSTLPEASRRVLALLAQGMRDAEMARELSLSESAVRKLVQRTLRSVGARTRCQAVAIAARAGQLG